MLLNHTNRRRVLATVATTAAFAGVAPAAVAMLPDGGGAPSTVPEQDRVKVVRVQVDQGLDWVDAGIGAAGMLALVLAGFGGAHALNSVHPKLGAANDDDVRGPHDELRSRATGRDRRAERRARAVPARQAPLRHHVLRGHHVDGP